MQLISVIIDAAELEPESEFWHRLLGGSRMQTPTHHFIQADGLPMFVVQLAPEHLPPGWPEGSPQQMHVDLSTDDLAAADRRALDGGGRRLRPLGDVDRAAPTGSRVYASPAGHPFCLRTS